MAVAQVIADLTLEEVNDATLDQLITSVEARLNELAGMTTELQEAYQKLTAERERRGGQK
ncbi:MAG: hypothetical protein QNJ92_16815 [Alphaproteobacteria bacterium]|nr:hypothetical protein [Alphaproteobacteria bacterium]